jgi:hypothetical protein
VRINENFAKIAGKPLKINPPAFILAFPIFIALKKRSMKIEPAGGKVVVDAYE